MLRSHEPCLSRLQGTERHEDAGAAGKVARHNLVWLEIGGTGGKGRLAFIIPSFDYLALAEWEPIPTPYRVAVARPEMMALANLLHHPEIGGALIANTGYKRSNKDLGRVLALAYLATLRDRRAGEDDLGRWPERMWAALQEKFGDHASRLASQAGKGLSALLSSPADLDQALRIANLGLLASFDVSPEAFQATGARFMGEVIDEMQNMARQSL